MSKCLQTRRKGQCNTVTQFPRLFVKVLENEAKGTVQSKVTQSSRLYVKRLTPYKNSNWLIVVTAALFRHSVSFQMFDGYLLQGILISFYSEKTTILQS